MRPPADAVDYRPQACDDGSARTARPDRHDRPGAGRSRRLASILTSAAAHKPPKSLADSPVSPIERIVSSPLERCQQTAQFIAEDRGVAVETDARLIECGYGDWTGQEIKKLAKDPLWKVVQSHPSAVTFPGEGGEAMRDAQVRAVDAVRSWNDKLGSNATWLACSHADIIKAIVADALGMHLDTFQRIVIDPCSVTVINYTALRPFVVRVNDTGTDLGDLARTAEEDLAQPSRNRLERCRGRRRRRRRIGSLLCPVRSFVYDPPDRLVVGTVGQPGQRTFFIQARGAGQLTSVVVEKLQVAALAERLDQLARRGVAGFGRHGLGARGRAPRTQRHVAT